MRFELKGKNQCIKAKLNKDGCGHGWVLSLNSANKDGFKVTKSTTVYSNSSSIIIVTLQVIDAASVDFWSKDVDELRLEMENFTYPPSFQVHILSPHATASSFMKVRFKNVKEEFSITLPLEYGLVPSHKSKA